MLKRVKWIVISLTLLLAVNSHAGVDSETSYILNTFLFLIFGALVMWMCAGFTMLEAGSVRTKNASVICLKNIGLYSIAGIMYYAIGYNLMYTGESGFLGDLSWGVFSPADEASIFNNPDDASSVSNLEGSHSGMSNWFFQMVFVATTASIVSGTLAERVRLVSFLVFIVFLTGVIYPIVGKWTWGEGWLNDMGFVDFAGSTIVHSTGGWAALAGALIVGARRGKFRDDGSVRSTPPSNVPIVTLGVFILWLGWFGFNGGSQLALGSTLDAISMGVILVNTNLAAAAGTIVAIVLSKPIFGRVDLLIGLNGAIAGLVSITAAPDFLNHDLALLVGGIGGAVCVLGMKALEKLKIDDVVGAVSAHLFAGVWGTFAACITVGADFVTQLVGIASIGLFVFGASIAVWLLINLVLRVRVDPEAEMMGQDATELGIEAYPEFVLMPDEDIEVQEK